MGQHQDHLSYRIFLGLFPDGIGYACFREGRFASKVRPNLEYLSCATIIQTRFTPGKAILTRRDYHGRISDRALGVYEGTQEILAITDRPLPGVIKYPYRVDGGFSSCSVYLYLILNALALGLGHLINLYQWISTPNSLDSYNRLL